MKKSKKSLISAVTALGTVASVVAPATTALADTTNGWALNGQSWTYYTNGQMVKNGWVQDSGKWYLMGADGTMVTGWAQAGGVWYLMGANGAMESNKWVQSGSTWYYLGANGAMVANGWAQDGTSKKWYAFDASGAMKLNQWVGNYYVGSTGAMLVDTLTPDGYFVDANGKWDGKAKKTGVISVTPLNGTQVEVKFMKAIDKASLFSNGKDGAFVNNTVEFKTLDNKSSGALTGKLSKDGKTLTITSENALSKRYDVTIDLLKATDRTSVDEYKETLTIKADKTSPTIVSTTKVSASVYKVTFSEPIAALGTVSAKLANGDDVTGEITNDFDPLKPAKEVKFTMGAGINVNKQVTVTLIGTRDEAVNLVNPNPATVTFVKGDKDGYKPTVYSIVQTSAKKFSIKFSEELLAKPVVKIGTTVVNANSIEKDDDDATKYIVTAPDVLDGAKNIAVEQFTDLSGEAGTDMVKVVSFNKDEAAPKVSYSAAVIDNIDKKQYLEITFDRDVELTNPTVALIADSSYVKDYVTNAFTATAQSIAFKDSDNKKLVRVALDTLLPDASDKEGCSYKVKLHFVGVDSGAGVTAKDATVTFTRSKDGEANTSKVTVDTVTQGADNNKVAVTFTEAVDGASAVNVNNYRVDGAIVTSVSLQPVIAKGQPDEGKQVAILNLKANSNGFTGDRNVTVSNVKAKGSSKVMDVKSTIVNLKENVVPVIKSAKITSTTSIELKFSEAMTNSNGLDFEVLVGGKSRATKEEVNVALSSDNKSAIITVTELKADDLSKGITLKALDTRDLKDTVLNKLSVPSNVNVTQ